MDYIRRFSFYFALLGIALVTAGIVSQQITGKWSIESLILLIVGISFLVVWLILTNRFNWKFWQKSATIAETKIVIITLLVIASLGLINFVAVRYSTRLDLTETKLFTVAPESQKIVRDLPKPLKVWIFSPQINPSDRELLENYRRYGKNFNFEFVDPRQKIGLAEQFKVKPPGEVHLEYGKKKKLVQTLNPEETISEIQLTNAIEQIQIQRDRPLNLYFLQGNGELALKTTPTETNSSQPSLSQAVTNLENKGYTVKPLNLTTNAKIPQTANVAIVAGAKKPLFPAEITRLQQYLESGGRLLLLLDPKIDLELEPLLKNWGIGLDDRLVVNDLETAKLLGLSIDLPIANSYGNHPITQDFGEGISIYPNSRAITLEPVSGIDAIALVKTSDRAWAESNLQQDKITFDPKQDRKGPLDLAVALTKKTKSDREARIVIFGSSTFATNGWFEQPQTLNADLFLNSVNWLANDKAKNLSIRPKQPNNRRINLNPLQALLLNLMALAIVPLLGLIAAGITWWRRR
jgi:ABC-type uncharacterized transport system involved in gliding motility auxiliary subunit